MDHWLQNLCNEIATPCTAINPPKFNMALQLKIFDIELPSVYYEYMDIFGSGSFRTPAFELRINYLNDEWCIGYTKTALEVEPEATWDPLFPSNPGRFPFGSTNNGTALFWLTVGHRDSWPIVATFEYVYTIINMTLSEFLHDTFMGTNRSGFWTADEVVPHPSQVVFEPRNRRMLPPVPGDVP